MRPDFRVRRRCRRRLSDITPRTSPRAPTTASVVTVDADFAVSSPIQTRWASDRRDVSPASPSTFSMPAFATHLAADADFAVSSPLQTGWASNPRDVSPAAPTTSSTPALTFPAAVAADFAISSKIQPRWASNPRDVSPTAPTASSTAALSVSAAVAADFAIFSSIHLGCFSNPRDVSPAAPTTSSTPAFAVPAAVAVDLAVSSLIEASNQRDHLTLDFFWLQQRFLDGFPTAPSTSSPCALAVVVAVAADFAVSPPIRPRRASKQRDVSPAASPGSSTPTLAVPAAVAGDFAVSSLIHLGCFSNPRGVSPAAPTTSSTPALAVPAAVAVDFAVSPRVGLKSTGRVPRSTLRLVDVRARRPRPRRRRLWRFLPDSAANGRDKSPVSPLASSPPTFATVAAAATDLDISPPIGLQIKRTDGRLLSPPTLLSLSNRAYCLLCAPSSRTVLQVHGCRLRVAHNARCLLGWYFAGIGAWDLCSAMRAAQLVSSRMKYESVLES
ncbi:hypothetical protein MSAN_00475800 [Mycena sanguinolenta]|uniref:Uncharacterized protein n=1 Tax=Mycena sanguinolenta TaxID=230812 RepID=A0A8H6ZFC7_9AGAR|nr:hypothetical protein MSAN_00475800 [Mycena sanguinolenta]